MTPWCRPDEVVDALTELRQRFPTAVVWFGLYTEHWWAVTESEGFRLVEALSPEELVHAIEQAVSWPWPSASAWVGPSSASIGVWGRGDG